MGGEFLPNKGKFLQRSKLSPETTRTPEERHCD